MRRKDVVEGMNRLRLVSRLELSTPGPADLSCRFPRFWGGGLVWELQYVESHVMHTKEVYEA